MFPVVAGTAKKSKAISYAIGFSCKMVNLVLITNKPSSRCPKAHLEQRQQWLEICNRILQLLIVSHDEEIDSWCEMRYQLIVLLASVVYL